MIMIYLFFYSSVLAFYFCITNFHKPSSLKQKPFITSQVLGVRGPVCFTWVLHSGSHQAEIKVSASGILIWRLDQGKIHFQVPWQSSFYCSCMNEVPIFVMASSQRPLSAPRGHSQVLVIDSPSKSV